MVYKSVYNSRGHLRLTPLAACLLAALIAGRARATSEVQSSLNPTPAPRVDSLLLVTNCADDGSPGTLRSAIAAAVSGDTIDLTQLTCGAITLLAGEIAIHVDDLTIDGPGRDVLTIDGNQNGRVFHHPGAGTLTLRGLAITNGSANSLDAIPTPYQGAYGGCILSYVSESEVVSEVALIDSSVTNCRATVAPGGESHAAKGGGIFARSLRLDGSIVAENRAENQSGYLAMGGGAFSVGPVEIVASEISGNRAETSYRINADTLNQATGGGVWTTQGGDITDTIISNNFAGCDTTATSCIFGVAGGIRSTGALLTITSSVVVNNTIEAGGSDGDVRLVGAGIAAADGLTVAASTITGNVAHTPTPENCSVCIGGGIQVTYGDSHIVSSTIADNSSAGAGGGVYAASAHLRLSNSTISHNYAADAGGGVFAGAGGFVAYPIVMQNSTVTANSAVNGGGIVDTHPSFVGSSSMDSSIVFDNMNIDSGATYGADFASTATTSISGANNLVGFSSGVALPPDTLNLDPMLGPLQDNGGSTSTHALLPGSPGIDAGNNSANLDFDQRGLGFPRVSGVAPDIGAFEMQVAMPDTIFSNGFDRASQQR
jgi:hypothetical protein